MTCLGYIVRTNYLLLRRRVAHHLRAKMRAFEALLVKEGRGFRRYGFDPAILDRLAATLASYLGHFKMANTYHLCRSLWDRFPFLSHYVTLNPTTWSLVRKDKYPKGMRTTSQQYGYYQWRFSGDVLFFRVGRFFECYRARDRDVAQRLGLRSMGPNSRGARYEFPVTRQDWALGRLLQQDRSVTVILEREPYLTWIKTRMPAYRFEPCSAGLADGSK